ncbi:MAG TPA: response regulator, partial [Vicinamibacterales bacterium]|nr:response regulator [Vicinamibacterales bacterium]
GGGTMSKSKILIVEDDADVRLGYQIVLKANGYETFFAADTIGAISQARKQNPDLIILDLGLPGGDGYVVLERLRTNLHLGMIPIIVVSARDLHANRERALKAGAKAYMQKPWNDSELLLLIRTFLGQPDASAAAPQ